MEPNTAIALGLLAGILFLFILAPHIQKPITILPGYAIQLTNNQTFPPAYTPNHTR